MFVRLIMNPTYIHAMTLTDNHVRIGSRIISVLFLTCAAMILSGCSQKEDPVEIEDNVQVSLRVDEVFQEKAYVRLNHNGSQDDYWYYMVTKDMVTDAEEMLNGEIARVLDAAGEIVGNVGTNKNITIDNLEAKTDYRVIAARLLPDASVTGNVAELVFRTLRDPNVFEKHPSWSISYKERRVSEDDPDTETEVFECKVGESTDTYVPCLLSKQDFEASYGGNLRACFEDYVAFRNLGHAKWPNVIKDQASEHIEDRLRHGDYIIFMIGIDAQGELTGYYARTDCTIEQEPALDSYRNWVGKWTLVGKYDNQEIRYSVEISPEENNLYLRMSGWEHTTASEYFEALPYERPIQLYFEKSTGFVYVVSEEIKDFEDPALADFYDFYLYGCVEIMYGDELTEVPVDIPNLRIARFALADDNHAVATPEIFSFDLNGVHYDAPFLYFNYSYISILYAGLVPVTTDSVVPRIDTMRLER